MLRAQSVAALAVVATAACTTAVDPIGSGPTTSSVSSSTVEAVGGSSQGGNGLGGSGQGGSADGGGSSGGGNPTAAGGAGPTSIALFRGELPEGEGGFGSTVAATGTSGAGGAETSGGTSGVGGASPDGADLFVAISDGALLCGDPFGHPCSGAGVAIYLWLTPQQQAAVGTTFELPDLGATSGQWESERRECMSTGTGPSTFGTLTLLASDSTSVRVDLEGSQFPTLDGVSTVTRCNQVLDWGSIAYSPSDFPDGAGGASSVTVTSGGGGDLFTIKLGNHPLTCGDPFPEPGPGQTFEDFTITLPLDMVVADESYPLSDPRIECEAHVADGSAGGAVTSSGGPAEPGLIHFVEVTPSYVYVEVEGTAYDFANGAGQVPRCGG